MIMIESYLPIRLFNFSAYHSITRLLKIFLLKAYAPI